MTSSGARRRNRSKGSRRREARESDGDDNNVGRGGRSGKLIVQPMPMEKPSSRDKGYDNEDE